MTPRFTAAVESTEGRGSGYVDVARAVSGLVIDPPAPPEPPRLTGEVAGVPDSLAGGHDCSAEFRAFLDRVPDGAEVRFPGGNPQYRHENLIPLLDRSDLAFRCADTARIYAETDGSGTTPPEGIRPKDWPISRARFHGRRSHRILFGAGLQLDGGHVNAGTNKDAYVSSRAFQHAFALHSCSDWTVEGEPDRPLGIRNVYGDFFWFGKDGSDGDLTRRVAVRHVDASGTGRQGLAFTGCEDILVELNRFGEVRRASMDFEPNGMTTPIRRVWVRHNEFGPRGLNFISAGAGGPDVGHIAIEDNRLVGGSLQADCDAPGVRRGPIAVRRNVADTQLGNKFGAMLYFLNWNGVEVIENHAVAQRDRNMYLVVTEGCTGVSVHGNVLVNGAGEWRAVA